MKKLSSTPVAHRGLHGGDIPENSLTAFEEAVRHRYAVETDVRLSKDGELVIFHDNDLSRMTGSGKRVIDCPLSELETLSLKGTGEKIPTLGLFLKLIGGRTPILLEIKDVPEADTKEFLAKIARAFDGYKGEYAVQSFQPKYVHGYKKLRPEIDCGLLATGESAKEDFDGSPLWRIKAYAVRHMSFNFFIRPDFISYHFSDLPTRETNRFKGPKFAWTIRSPEEEEYARKYADNIIFEGFFA